MSPSHPHAAWGLTAAGKFATALETVYPHRLCEAVVSCVQKFFSIPVRRPLAVLRCRGEQPARQLRPERLAAARQPRGSATRALLPEFSHFFKVKSVFSPSDSRLRPGHTWVATTIGGTAIPAGAKTVRTYFTGEPGTNSAKPSLPSRGCLKYIDQLTANDLYIGRSASGPGRKLVAASKWANPFRLSDCPDRATCLYRFSSHLRSSPSLLSALPELFGKRLVCHCLPSQACHADVLIQTIAETYLDGQTRETSVHIWGARLHDRLRARRPQPRAPVREACHLRFHHRQPQVPDVFLYRGGCGLSSMCPGLLERQSCQRGYERSRPPRGHG